MSSGFGCKEVYILYRFPHNYYLSLLHLYPLFFAAASLIFVNFFVLVSVHFCIFFFFFFTHKKTHKGDYGRPTCTVAV